MDQAILRSEGEDCRSSGNELRWAHTDPDPHDPEARYSRKRIQEWVGGKVKVTETDDEEYPHIITNIAETCISSTDYEVLSEIQEQLEERDCLPGKQYVDSSYMSGPNLAASQKKRIDLLGPPCPVVSNQFKLPNGINTDQFMINTQRKIATCPAGFSAGLKYKREGKLRFRFLYEVCAGCSLCERCCTGKRRRTVCVGLTYPLLQEARKRQKRKNSRQNTINIAVVWKAVSLSWLAAIECGYLVMPATKSTTCKPFSLAQRPTSRGSPIGWLANGRKDIIGRGYRRNKPLQLDLRHSSLTGPD